MSARLVQIRAAVTLITLAAILLGPPLLVAIGGCVALINVSELCSRVVPSRDAVARPLLGMLAGVSLLIVLGVVLNLIPGGLTRTGWALGWTVIGFLGLGIAAGTDGLGSLLRPASTIVAASAVVTAGLAGGTVLANAGVHKQASEPQLAFSSPRHDATSARLEVQGVSSAGRYVITVRPDGRAPGVREGSILLSGPGQTSAGVSIALPPASTHWVVVLSAASHPVQAEREVILWRR